jgi:hypothetical protein
MRQKKRYVLTRKYPDKVPEGTDFLYQDKMGYVFRVPLSVIREFPDEFVLLKSGSIRKIKRFNESTSRK